MPSGELNCYGRSPIDFHDGPQVAGTPLFDDDHFIIKFNNYWTIELPPGYSLLITHPINRHDLPFMTLTGLVDADRYVDNFIHFPARWRDPAFNGTLPAGTPVAQCLPTQARPLDRAVRHHHRRRRDAAAGDGRRDQEQLRRLYRRKFRVAKH